MFSHCPRLVSEVNINMSSSALCLCNFFAFPSYTKLNLKPNPERSFQSYVYNPNIIISSIKVEDDDKQVSKTTIKPTLVSPIFNTLDTLINNFIDPPLKPSINPKHVLSNNFAPVEQELPPTECQVIQGSVPSSLNGVYIRNGPNPQYFPQGPHHWFDGDGMLHAIQISQGRATFCSRYVKTYRFVLDREFGYPISPKVFSNFNAFRIALFIARVIAGHYNPANGCCLANTSLAFFGNRLYALGESGLPHLLQVTSDGDILTIRRREDFADKLFMNMTAHFKIDPDTGKAFAFSYGLMKKPFLTYFCFDSNGNKKRDVPIYSMSRPSFLHDFAITKKYAIFADTQLEMNVFDMIVGSGSPIRFNTSKVPKLGVLPLDAEDESEIRWFNVLNFNIVHAINAWDEEDAVILIAPNIKAAEHALERMELVHSSIEKVRIDLKTGGVTRNLMSKTNLDFAVINQSFVGKKNRYVYAAVGDPFPKVSGVVKLDLSKENCSECTVASRSYGPGCYGGEPFFVARDVENSNHDDADEDDGYLVSYVHDERTGESKFIVMDAKSSNLDIIATVKLPSRVPYGFHGLFIKEMNINKL